MLLKVIREIDPASDPSVNGREKQTNGTMYIDGQPFCSTIEPPHGYASGNNTSSQVSDNNTSSFRGAGGIKGCVPKGWYRVRVTYSPKFKRPLPLLYMVPGFEGIRIHAGLRVENTQGCICVGVRANEERLTNILMKAQNEREEIYICITDTDSSDGRLPQSESTDRYERQRGL